MKRVSVDVQISQPKIVVEVQTQFEQPSGYPDGILLNDDGEPILTDDGDFIYV